MGMHEFMYTYRHMCPFSHGVLYNFLRYAGSITFVVGLDNGSIYKCVLCQFSLILG